MLNVGDAAPAFSVKDQDGATVTLDQYRGTSVALWWYPVADTPG